MPSTRYRALGTAYDGWIAISNTTSNYIQLNDAIWTGWNTNATGGGLLTYPDVWQQWNTTSITSTQYRVDELTLWQGWLNDTLRRTLMARPRPAAAPLVRTEAEWDAIRAENERLRAERDRRNAAARAEARKLMAFVLTPAQLESYDRHGYFDVVGSEGSVFRLHHGTSGNVRQLVDGQEINRLCVHPRLLSHDGEGYLPTEDSLVAQALALMHDEASAVDIANVHAGPRRLRAVA